MGQGESQPLDEADGRRGVSYHCLRVAEGSPAAEAGIEPFFDFVSGVEGRPLVWHVLDVLEGSPAQSAGLVPYGDWIVGYSGGVLRGEGDFYDVVEAHADKPLRLFVYNADYDVTREAILVPNRSWGGEGLLGCGVGYGLLHRIPKPQQHNTKILPQTAPPQSAAYLASRQQSALPPPPPSQKPHPAPPPAPGAAVPASVPAPSAQQQAHQQRASDQSYNLSFGASGADEAAEEDEEEEPVMFLPPGGNYSRYDDPYGAPLTPDAGRTSFGQPAGGYGGYASGGGYGGNEAYMASEGVEVVAVADGEGGDFERSPPPAAAKVLPRRGSGMEEAVFMPEGRAARTLGFGGHAPGIAPGDF